MRRTFPLSCLWLVTRLSVAADPPYAEIDNGQIHVKLYLPDARNGYYRATRFDWSGVIASLEYKGHNYYGPWFTRADPKIHDFGYDGDQVVASPCAADTGPVEEFQTNGSALGWDEAKPGGNFIKIGVGVLRKDGERYDFVKLYPILSTGKWSVERHPDSVVFTQELTDPPSGYGYIYRKTVELISGKPGMVLDHSLKNTAGARSRAPYTITTSSSSTGRRPARILRLPCRFRFRPAPRPPRASSRFAGTGSSI
jgi:hypothetical protein